MITHTRPLSIAICSNGVFPFQIGGVQKHSYFLCKYLAQKDVHVTLYHSSNNRMLNLGQYYSSDELEKMKFIEVSFPKTLPFPGHYVLSSWIFSKRIYKKLNDKDFDAIYAQGFTGWYFLSKHPFKPNLVTNLHGLNMFQHSINIKTSIGLFLLKIPAKTIIRKSKHQISLGGKLKNILLKVGAAQNSIITIPNGINKSWLSSTEEFMHLTKKKPEKINYIFIGRYERLKGIEELHSAMLETINNNLYQIDFIGPMPEKKKINHPSIKYHGTIYDDQLIKSILKRIDVLICPSYSEGMPTVILEAMSCGCAIIASDVGAICELVDKKNGILIEPGNTRQLKEAMLTFNQMSPSELSKMKMHSINKLKDHFIWDIVADKTIDLIKSL